MGSKNTNQHLSENKLISESFFVRMNAWFTYEKLWPKVDLCFWGALSLKKMDRFLSQGIESALKNVLTNLVEKKKFRLLFWSNFIQQSKEIFFQKPAIGLYNPHIEGPLFSFIVGWDMKIGAKQYLFWIIHPTT